MLFHLLHCLLKIVLIVALPAVNRPSLHLLLLGSARGESFATPRSIDLLGLNFFHNSDTKT